jgi:hypothetical protein
MDIYSELWKFNDILFNDLGHIYKSSDVDDYISVTKYVDKFKFPVKWDKIAGIKAIKLGVTKEELLDTWAKKGKKATTLGTEIHSYIENLWHRKVYKPDLDILEQYDNVDNYNEKAKICDKIYAKLTETYIPIANELIVYDKIKKICGTIDFLAYNKKTHRIDILDWKTSKEFQTQGRNYMLYPYQVYQDCNINHYSLQLSIYKWIIEHNTDIKIDQLLLVQINNEPKICKCVDFGKYLWS